VGSLTGLLEEKSKMPLYNYRCRKCHKVVELLKPLREFSKSVHSQCCPGQLSDLVVTGVVTRGDGFGPNGSDPITLEHIADEPKTFRTQKELRKYCREHGLSSGALL